MIKLKNLWKYVYNSPYLPTRPVP